MARYLGEHVELIDDGSADSLVDLRIRYSTGLIAYGEVVIDGDPRWTSTANAIRDRHFEIAAPNLSRQWWLMLGRRAMLKTVESQAVLLLAELETVGLMFERHADLERLAQSDSAAVARLLKLGVIEIVSRPLFDDETAGVVHVRPEGAEGFVEDDWDSFLAATERLVRRPALDDVRGKLMRTGADERHAFIGITFTSEWSLTFWLASEHADVPHRDPELPPEITHLWLWGVPIGRVLGWFPGSGWFDPRSNWVVNDR